MPDEIKINRPQVQPQPQPRPEYNQPVMADMGGSVAAARPSKMPWIVLAAVVVILIVAAVVFRNQLFGKGKSGGSVMGVSTSAYQAVFLTNGQVYFGKLSNAGSDYVTLQDIYYLQVVQPPLQGQGADQSAQQPQISLVKLGNELHGPVDEMQISRTQVLFYENLKDDGQVVKAIVQDKNK